MKTGNRHLQAPQNQWKLYSGTGSIKGAYRGGAYFELQVKAWNTRRQDRRFNHAMLIAVMSENSRKISPFYQAASIGVCKGIIGAGRKRFLPGRRNRLLGKGCAGIDPSGAYRAIGIANLEYIVMINFSIVVGVAGKNLPVGRTDK